MSIEPSDVSSGATASLLLVVGSELVQRHVWQYQHCAYWTAAFETLLEKHGLLDFDRADEMVLDDPQKLACYDALIVGWLPGPFWKNTYIESLESFNGPVFLEGPLDHPRLQGLLGVIPSRDEVLERGRLALRDDTLRAWVKERFSATLEGRTDTIEIAPKVVATKYIEPDLVSLRSSVSPERPREAAHKLALTGVIALRRRFERTGRFFPDPRLDAAAELTCVEFVERLTPCPFRQEYLGFLSQVMADASTPATSAATEERDEVAHVRAHAAALYEKLVAADTPTSGRSAEKETPPPWCNAAILRVAQDLVELTAGAAEALDRGKLPLLLDGQDIVQILLLAAALDHKGHSGLAVTLLRLCLAQAYDPDKGAFLQARARSGRLHLSDTYSNSPWIVFALVCLSEGTAIDDSAAATHSAYSDEWAARWSASPLRIGQYRTAEGARELAAFEQNGEHLAGVVESSRFLGCTFPLLAWLTHHHTMHPLEQPFFDCPPEAVLVMEALLFHTLERWLVDAGLNVLKVQAWPWDSSYCLTVRCDVDRLPTAEQHHRLLDWQREKKFRSSWYWIPERIDASLIAEEEDQGHEIGLHALTWREKEKEVRAVDAALSRQSGLTGETLHVGGSDYWLGWPSVEAAQRTGLRYTEFVPTVFDLPYAGFPVVTDEGEVAVAAGCVGITHNAAPEAIPGRTRKAGLISRPDVTREWCDNGFHVGILHHPDGSLDTLAGWIEQLPATGRLAWPNARVAEWWRKTHRRAALRVVRQRGSQGENSWEILASEDVADMELRLLGSTGSAANIEIDDNEDAEAAPLGNGEGFRIRLSLDAGVPRKLRLRR